MATEITVTVKVGDSPVATDVTLVAKDGSQWDGQTSAATGEFTLSIGDERIGHSVTVTVADPRFGPQQIVLTNGHANEVKFWIASLPQAPRSRAKEFFRDLRGAALLRTDVYGRLTTAPGATWRGVIIALVACASFGWVATWLPAMRSHMDALREFRDIRSQIPPRDQLINPQVVGLHRDLLRQRDEAVERIERSEKGVDEVTSSANRASISWLIAWPVAALMTFLAGSRLLSQLPPTTGLTQYLGVFGFATVGLLVTALVAAVGLQTIALRWDYVVYAGWAWWIAAMSVAAREALGYGKAWWRAVITGVLGAAVVWVVVWGVVELIK